MIGIVVSEADSASKNLYLKMKEKFGGTEQEGKFFFVHTSIRSPFVEDLPAAEAYIFASRHASQSGLPTLCVHAPGNWSQAAVGGSPRELAHTDPFIIKAILLELQKQKEALGLKYEVTLECTHHGPTHFKKPCVFAEVGSSETQWNDTNAVRAVANSIIEYKIDKSWKPFIGIGGGHYPIEFTKVQLETDLAVGHICPKYEMPDMEMIGQALEKGVAKGILIDWKGSNKQHHDLAEEAADKFGVELLRTQKM